MSTFSNDMMTVGAAMIPGATDPTSAGIQANGFSNGYCNIGASTRTSAGVYVLHLQEDTQSATSGLSSSECIVMLSNRTSPTAGNSNYGYVWTSALLLTISSFVVAAATDADLDVLITRVRRVA